MEIASDMSILFVKKNIFCWCLSSVSSVEFSEFKQSTTRMREVMVADAVIRVIFGWP